MADSNKSVNVITKGSVTVNVNNKTVEKDVTQKKASTKNSFANESATSSKSSQSQKVDTGADRFSGKDVSDFSKSAKSILSQMSEMLKERLDPVYDGIQKSAEKIDDSFDKALNKIKSDVENAEKKASEDKRKEEEEKRKELLNELEKEKKAATNEAISALRAYDENFKNRTSVFSDAARAGVSSAYKASHIGGLSKASATLALGAINPALGSLTQMFLSNDGVGPYIKSMFNSMFSFAKKETSKTLKNLELEDRVTIALRNSAINVEELLKKTKDLKNIDVKSLVKGNESKTKSMFAEQTVASDNLTEQVQQQNFITRFTNSMSNMFRSFMPSKKIGAEEAHDKTMSDLFARKVSTNTTENVLKSDSWKEIFELFKKGLVSTLGLISIYFSGDQFKAWLKDFITTPFKNLATSIKTGTFSFEDNWKDLAKAIGIAFVGVKGILGNFSTLSGIVKLASKGLGSLGGGLFAGLTAYHAYQFKKALDEKDTLGMFENGILGVTNAVALFIPQFRVYAALIEATNALLKWYLNRKLEEEKIKHAEAVNKSLKGVRSDTIVMKEITEATKKDVSVDEFADMKRRNLTKEQMIEEISKKNSAVLSDAQLSSAMKAYEHRILYSKFRQEAFNKVKTQDLNALYRSDKISGEEKELLKEVIDVEDAIMKSGLSVREYFDRPVLAAEIVKNTSALNINQTPQDLANNLTGQVTNYVPQVQVPTAALTAEMVKTAPENTKVINDKFCVIENLLVELNNSINVVNNSIQTKKSTVVGGIPSSSTTIAATGR